MKKGRIPDLRKCKNCQRLYRKHKSVNYCCFCGTSLGERQLPKVRLSCSADLSRLTRVLYYRRAGRNQYSNRKAARCLQALAENDSKQLYRIVVLHLELNNHGQSWSFAKIGRQTGLSESTVRSRYHIAVRKMREMIWQ